MHHFRHRATRWNADTRSRLRTPRISGEEATASERREMEDFAVWALNRTLRGIFPLGAYQDMGFDRSDIEEIRQLRRQRAAGGDETAFRKFFRRDLHAGLVRNMRKVGVLTNRVAPDLEALGISLAAA
jgi:hypothetical protein